jgi:hypothetical protein
MSGLGIAGGLGAVGNSFIEGMNGARDRQYLESQRARQIEEQQRADQERKDLQGIKTTEEYQAENPDWVEPVRKDDEGNDMPGVTDAGKTITATRNRSQAAITGDIANVYKKSGNIAQYTANTEKAQKLTLDDANKQATALMAQADGMPLMDYAKAAANIFSSDALPFSIKGVKEDSAGGVVFTVQNDQNGVQRQVPFKDTASINRALQSMYQPETFQKLQADRAASMNKINEERMKPYNLAPGGKHVDPMTGAQVQNNNGLMNIGTDENPQLVPYGRSGAGGAGGAGKAGKVEDPLAAVSATIKSNIELSSDAKGLDANQISQANTIGRSLAASAARERRNIDPSVAAQLGIAVAKDPSLAKDEFNPETNSIDKVVEFQGNKFPIESYGSPTNTRLEPAKMNAIASNYISTLDQKSRLQLIPAAFNGEARGKLEAQIDARVRSQQGIDALASRLGRDPTEADLARASEEGKKAIAPQLEMISRWGPGNKETTKLIGDTLDSAGYTRDGKAVKPSQQDRPASSLNQEVGGLYRRPSRAETMQHINDARKSKDAAEAAREAELTRTAPVDAQRLLSLPDTEDSLRALEEFQHSSAFNKLDFATKQKIYNRVNGLQK